MTDLFLQDGGLIIDPTGALVVGTDPENCECCGAQACLGCLAGTLLSEGACPHAPGDTLTLVVTRPTRTRSIRVENCGFGGCYGCAGVKTIGGDPIKLRYTYEGRYWVFYPPSFAFDQDPNFPACQRAGPQNPCLTYIGCTEGGVQTPPFVVPPPPGCANGVQPCVAAPTLATPPPATWRFAGMRFDLPCDTAEEAQCCNPCGGALPGGCFACGMSKYQTRMSVAYPWAREIFLYRCGQKPFGQVRDADGNITAQTSDLWQQFLGFAHAETHYLFDPSCREIPANVPVEPDGDTIPPLSSVVPKLYIYACAGVPMFEFDFLSAATAGVISQSEALEAIKTMRRLGALAFNLSPAEVTEWRSTMAKLEAADRLATIDWRGKASAELAAAAGTIPQFAGCSTPPVGLPELGPVRKSFYPALDPRQAVDTAQAFQMPVCEGVVLGTGDPNYVAWASIQHTYFRCAPGGWTFAAWLFGSDPLIPEDPKFVWYGRTIGHNVIPHSQIAQNGFTDFAWNASGIPNVVVCTSSPCPDPPGFPCQQVDLCDEDGGSCPSLVQACDLAYGHASYGSTCTMFVASWGQYSPSEILGQQVCECSAQNAAYVVRSKVGCTFDTSAVPWIFRERTEVDDAIPQPEMPYPGAMAACSTCQGLNQGVPPIGPGGSADTLCLGHVCWDATQICGGYLAGNPASFAAPTISDPVCTPAGGAA